MIQHQWQDTVRYHIVAVSKARAHADAFLPDICQKAADVPFKTMHKALAMELPVQVLEPPVEGRGEGLGL